MDPLSDVLALMKPQSYVSGGYFVPPRTAIRFPTRVGVKCYAVLSGHCWVAVSGQAPVLLNAGECYVLPHGKPFCLVTDFSAEPMDYDKLSPVYRWGDDVPNGQEDGCFLAGGHFMLTGAQAKLLLQPLPFVVHIHSETDKRAVQTAIERMREETYENRPGSSLVIQQLAYALLIQAVRLYAENESERGSGWLFALTDKQLSKAVYCMHERPGHPWTLDELASEVGMSRSLFTARFREVVGTPPVEYLTRWRMLLACEKLTCEGMLLSEIASSLGYDSESAFGKAFKRVMGCSPRQYKRTTT